MHIIMVKFSGGGGDQIFLIFFFSPQNIDGFKQTDTQGV